MTEALAILALAATLTCIAALTYLHLLPTGYRPLHDAVSDYGVGPHRAWYRVQASALGTAGLLLALGLWHGVDPAPWKTILCLVAFGFSRIAIPWYPTDLEGQQRTPTGRIHIRLAGIAFLSVAVAAPAFHRAVSSNPDWTSIAHLLGPLGWAVTASCALTVISVYGRLRPWFGLVERLLYVAMIAWFLVVSVHLA